MKRAYLGALSIVFVVACAQTEAPTNPREAQISLQEAERGVEACKSYVARVCSCAKNSVELAKRCEADNHLPETLRLSLVASRSASVSAKDRLKAVNNVRQRMSICIEKDNGLDPATCPRTAQK